MSAGEVGWHTLVGAVAAFGCGGCCLSALDFGRHASLHASREIPFKGDPLWACRTARIRRFVGLLLVTKLLPPGDAEAVRQVHAAVGPTFLTRLLLPLKTGGGTAPPQPGSEDVTAAAAGQQQEAATCALGLAVLSSFARVPELAGSDDMLEKLPLLLNVVRAGGIGPLLGARRGEPAAGSASGAAQPASAAGAGPAERDAGADEAAVQDALECAVAAARSGPEGAAVAAESGAAGAAVAALAACPQAATQRMSLALQLLAAVLGDEARRAWLAKGGEGGSVVVAARCPHPLACRMRCVPVQSADWSLPL